MDHKTRLLRVFLSIIILSLGVSLAWVCVHVASASPVNITWRQVNESGFGSLQGISTLDTFNGQLYAGTWALYGDVAEIWRTSDGKNWEQFSPAFTTATQNIYDAQPFINHLYVGTANDDGTDAEIWRTNGSAWEIITSNGFGDANNMGISSMAVFADVLIASTINPITGIEIWGSPTGNPGTWELLYTAAPGFDSSLDSYNGYEYIGMGTNNHASLSRTDNLITWTPVFTDGLGNPNNTMISSMAGFDGDFYIGLRNTVDGGEVWRTSNGVDFSPVVLGGLGNVKNQRPYGLINYDDHLYLVFSNYFTGAEVLRTSDGDTWEQVSVGGWGDIANINADYLDKGAAIFHNSIFIGTMNDVSGGQIWQMISNMVFLPAILK